MDSQHPKPTSPSEINPAFLEMLKGPGVKEPRQKNHAFSLKSLDCFGTRPSFSWNYNSSFKTKVGVFYTLLCTITLSFAMFVYFHEYIFCTDPGVSTQSSYGQIPETASFNNLNEIMAPAFMFSHLVLEKVDNKVKILVELPSDEILRCNFDFYAEFYTTNVFDFDSIQVRVPLKRNCDSTHQKWSKKSDWVEPTGAALEKMKSLYCIDSPDMSIYGDHAWCEQGCGYYKITIKQRSDKHRNYCPTKLILGRVVVTTQMVDNYLNLEDYGNPWSLYDKSESSELDVTLQQDMLIWFQEKKLVTQSHGMGILDEPKEESRLSFNSLSYKYTTIKENESWYNDVP